MEETKQKQERKWIGVHEVAEYLGLKPSTIYDYVRERRIPHHKIPGSRILKFKLPEIDRWLESCRIETTDEYIEKIRNKDGSNGNPTPEKARH
jgi:excisionase family DNA binding protein